jgi:hypothetical protein
MLLRLSRNLDKDCEMVVEDDVAGGQRHEQPPRHEDE